MREVIKGLLGQDESVRRFRAVYNLPKKERQELAKQKGREAYYAKDWAQDRDGIMTFEGVYTSLQEAVYGRKSFALTMTYPWQAISEYGGPSIWSLENTTGWV